VSFLFPLFLTAAAAAAVPIVLHLLERHPEQRVRFAAVAFLAGAPVEHTARRRVRELLLLALRVGALVLLALAFARPFVPAASPQAARLTVVAIDTSLSMSAPASAARARELAVDAIRSAPAGDDVAVVAFADRAAVIVRPTPDRGAAVSAIHGVTPGFGSTKYAAGLAAAGALFAGQSGAVVVVTDLQANGWDEGDRAAVPEAARVEVRDVGALPENLTIESLRADGGRVVASIRSNAGRTRDVRVRLTVDGRAAAETTVTVAAHGAAEAVLANVRPVGVVVATVDDAGGIPGDDSRYALMGGGADTRSLVVTTSGNLDRDAWYVLHAIAGLRGIAAVDLGGWTDEALSRYGSVLLLSTRGIERRGREKLAAYANAGGGLLVAAGPDVDGEVVADVLGSGTPLAMADGDPERVALQRSEVATQDVLTLAPADVRHPIFRAFGAEAASLGLVRFRRVAHVSGPSCQTIARFTSGDAAVLDCTAGTGRAIVVASDLNGRWNDFPVRASFVPFLDQAAGYLADAAGRGSEYLVGEVPNGLAAVPGVTTLTAAGGSRRVVVNVDPKESASDRLSPADFQASITRLKSSAARDVRAGAAGEENRQHLWQYLLAAMVLALVAEGVVARRMA